MATLRSMMKNLGSVCDPITGRSFDRHTFSFAVVLLLASAWNKTFKNLETTATV
jgi:hypothetical protein